MEFGWTKEQDAFRERVRSFLERELPANWETLACQSPGSQAVTDFSLEFCPKLAAAGLLVPHWPKEYGGEDATPWEHFILGEEMWRVGEPRGPQYYNVNWLGPAIMKFGTPEQKEFHLGRISKGLAIWSQGFSEPSAGSDLASLRTAAERDGDDYIVNGSKIWTSYARLSHFCFLLARVGSGKAGISVFLVPMDTPGIEVRPIRSVVGDGDLHEVFFTDVRVPSSCRLGEEGQGWDVASYALHFERVGIPRYALAHQILERAVRRLKANDRFDNAVVRDRASRALACCTAARLTVYQVIDQRAKNRPQSAYTSVARAAIVAAERMVGEFVLDFDIESLSGSGDVMLDTHHRRAITAGIAAGAVEIQYNLIARNLLNLPRG